MGVIQEERIGDDSCILGDRFISVHADALSCAVLASAATEMVPAALRRAIVAFEPIPFDFPLGPMLLDCQGKAGSDELSAILQPEILLATEVIALDLPVAERTPLGPEARNKFLQG